MKLFLSILALSMVFHANAQIPNPSFEVWDYYNTWSLEPEGWTTPNGQLITSVVQDSAAFDGDLAMRVTVLPGFEGGVPQSASTTVLMNEFPESIDLAVKCSIPDGVEDDKVSILLEFLYEDNVTHIEEWVAYDSILDWQEISIAINEAEVMVTEMRITVTAGFTNGLFGGSWDTWISVDAISVSVPQSVEVVSCMTELFPNPTSDGTFVLKSCDGTFFNYIRILGITGNEITWCTNCQSTDLIVPLPGTYLIQAEKINGEQLNHLVVVSR